MVIVLVENAVVFMYINSAWFQRGAGRELGWMFYEIHQLGIGFHPHRLLLDGDTTWS